MIKNKYSKAYSSVENENQINKTAQQYRTKGQALENFLVELCFKTKSITSPNENKYIFIHFVVIFKKIFSVWVHFKKINKFKLWT